ncbi:MAG TPA: LamG domain-containing protein [Hanamia sp.]|nr:LamG domain-containing protein [Hanamia sp.]
MKFLTIKAVSIFGFVVIVILSFSVTTNLTSCTKTNTLYDTTYVTVHDTTIVRDSIYDLKNGLVAYYSFQNGSLSDSSVYHNDIVFNSATKASDRFGKTNNAYLFNGTSDYMTVKNNESLNPDNITIYAIVYINGFYHGTCDGNQIVSKGYPYDSQGFYDLAFIDPNDNCTGSANTSNEVFAGGYGDNIPSGTQAGALSDTRVATGKWYHVAFTYDGLTAKMYIDGKLENSQEKRVSMTDNSNDLFIGKHENPPYPYYFNGILDELRIYNRALSAYEINQLTKLQY